jgi:hypothetical protein
LPLGLQTLDGVRFDVRGAIQLAGRATERQQLDRPQRVTVIKIQQRAAKVHLLHTEHAAENEGADEIALLDFYYANGEHARLQLPHVNHVSEGGAAEPVGNGLGEIATVIALPYARPPTLPIYRYTWVNPHPQWEITELNVSAPKGSASYVLIAVTTD